MGKDKSKRKILYISGTRADYGLMQETLLAIKRHVCLQIEIVATGMHLMREFGESVKEIEKACFKIHKIEAFYKEDRRKSMAQFAGEFILKLTKKISQIKPDIILLLGDRPEMLAGAIAGAYLGIPVAHVHGGERTSTVDELSRHAITKLAHFHLAATKKSAQRIIKMGENPKRVFVVGAPGLDCILQKKLPSEKEIAKIYKLNLFEPILLVLQHPLSEEIEDAGRQMKQTLEAIKELRYQSIVIYPNADAGGRKIIKVIEQYKKYPFIQIYKNISHREYLGLMRVANGLIGNSSGGIIEAPSFGLPVVNIGTRQENRERADNVIEVDYKKEKIIRAVKKIIFDKKFKEKIKKSKNPYGDGRASRRITDILSKIKINKELLQKKITY